MYGREGDESSDDSEEDFDMGLLAIATAAEDELLLAQAKGTTTSLTTKQKLALRRKLKFDLYYFLTFVTVFVWSMYARRTVKEAYRLQEVRHLPTSPPSSPFHGLPSPTSPRSLSPHSPPPL